MFKYNSYDASLQQIWKEGNINLIRKSQYIQLTLLILLIFVLFLLTATSISFQGDMVASLSNKSIEPEVTEVSEKTEQELLTGEYAIIIQGDNRVGGKNITKQLDCLKKDYKTYRTMEEVPILMKEHMKQLILCSSKTEGYYSYDDIIEASMAGVDIIFAVLPVGENLSKEWLDLLGIRYLGSRYTQKGIVCLDNFFVSNLCFYKDYKIRTLRVKTTSACKTFIAGINDTTAQKQLRNEDATDIVWRTIVNNSRIFVINGNFFSDMTHIGILGTILSKLDIDYLYPIVNAKMLFIMDAPYLTNENEETMKQRYARSSSRFLEEIAIPGIISLSMALEIQPQFYGVPYFYNAAKEYETDIVSFLHNELEKIGGNIEISANENKISKVTKGMDIFEKITKKEISSMLLYDYNEKEEKQIRDALAYKGHITNMIHRWEDMPSLELRNEYAYIPMMTEGYDMSDNVLLQLDGAASCLGLITHGISIKDILFPSSEEDDWSTAYKDFSANYYTACQKYDYLDGVDNAGLEQRVRQYCLMQPEITYKEEKINLKVDNLYTEGFFILRTNKKIEKISSGTYKKLETGVYLLTITEPETEILLNQNRNSIKNGA